MTIPIFMGSHLTDNLFWSRADGLPLIYLLDKGLQWKNGQSQRTGPTCWRLWLGQPQRLIEYKLRNISTTEIYFIVGIPINS